MNLLELLMGIDLGSTSIKAIIYGPQGNMVSEANCPTRLSHLNNEHSSWSVWEPDLVWDSVCDVVRRALSAIDDARDVKGVAVTGFGMDGVPIDKDGRDLFPFISWHCP